MGRDGGRTLRVLLDTEAVVGVCVVVSCVCVCVCCVCVGSCCVLVNSCRCDWGLSSI